MRTKTHATGVAPKRLSDDALSAVTGAGTYVKLKLRPLDSSWTKNPDALQMGEYGIPIFT